MTANYDSKLSRLKSRRLEPSDSIFKAELRESYENRSANQATRYALGALQEVDPSYTINSIAQGDRVKNQLEKGLAGLVPVTFEYQGSVPLNVHIRGVSDIDLLVLNSEFLTVDLAGVKNQSGRYTDWTGESSPQLLARLRSHCIIKLTSAFPEATVDVLGSKSIAIEGGSLSRKVDVVPSHWHDTAEYQRTELLKDRGVCILDAAVSQTFKNFPFLHMHHINIKDLESGGGAKKAIRLLKTIKSDLDQPSSNNLSSYDIASLVWHFNAAQLRVQSWNELSILAAVLMELTTMVANKASTMRLRTPDNTRMIFDSEEKFRSLVFLYIDVKSLAEAVAQEILGKPAVLQESVQSALQASIT